MAISPPAMKAGGRFSSSPYLDATRTSTAFSTAAAETASLPRDEAIIATPLAPMELTKTPLQDTDGDEEDLDENLQPRALFSSALRILSPGTRNSRSLSASLTEMITRCSTGKTTSTNTPPE